ncbi:MAG TPA: site-2 protease family protein [Candidatus Limnocylindria bacterium]|nr:site-2 protease family protein [Candidatus Limnocylindria bacterium]
MVVFICVLVLWIFSLCLHEYAHARVAFAGGDYTVEDKGYLEFNPLRYTDPILSIVFPVLCIVLGGFGLPGGCVWINTGLLRSRGWATAVSLAGPASNLALVLVLSILFRLGLIPDNSESSLSATMAFFAFLQITAIVFNLLPVPGLDGFGAIAPWLPLEIQEGARRLYGIAPMILILCMWQIKAAYAPFQFACALLLQLFGIDFDLVISGAEQFKFWQ